MAQALPLLISDGDVAMNNHECSPQLHCHGYLLKLESLHGVVYQDNAQQSIHLDQSQRSLLVLRRQIVQVSPQGSKQLLNLAHHHRELL